MLNSSGPRSFVAEVASLSLFGLGFVTYPSYIRDGSLGIENRLDFSVRDPVSAIEVREEESLVPIKRLLEFYN